MTKYLIKEIRLKRAVARVKKFGFPVITDSQTLLKFQIKLEKNRRFINLFYNMFRHQ